MAEPLKNSFGADIPERIGLMVRRVYPDFDRSTFMATALDGYEALELTELTQAAIPQPVRFKIAGLVTKYKGEKYLLLHRANRVYNHGNFAR